jgi:hypothetical protein
MVTVVPLDGLGMLGFVVSGRLTRADYEEVLLPPIQETIARGERIRVLAVIDDFQGLEPGALLHELKAAAKLGGGEQGPAPRFAVVTDTDWVRRGVALFGWLVPGATRVFSPAERAAAETWLSSAGDQSWRAEST